MGRARKMGIGMMIAARVKMIFLRAWDWSNQRERYMAPTGTMNA